MAAYPPDTLVAVPPFVHRSEGNQVTIGDLDRNVFLSIPAEGMDILNALAEGKTVGETTRLYQQKYDETPDIDDFLDALASEGFVSTAGASVDSGLDQEAPAVRRKWSFDWISPELARRFCGPPVLVTAALIISAALFLIVRDPSVLPGPTVFLFPGGHFAALTWATIFITIAGTAVHELAHAVAARAAGVKASIGMGNLLYTMVAQTEMTGIWLVPKRKRYLAYLFGCVVDAASASFLVGLLYASHQGIISVHPVVVALASSVFYTYLLRISFQLFFYLRTDVYYVMATVLNCKSLMADTEAFLRNVVAKLARRRHRLVDQAGIPRREMRAVRLYAALYLVGRTFSLLVLVFFYIPILWGYLYQVFLLVSGQQSRFGSVDFMTLGIIILAIDGGGIYLWVRSLRRARQRRRAGDPWSGSMVVTGQGSPPPEMAGVGATADVGPPDNGRRPT